MSGLLAPASWQGETSLLWIHPRDKVQLDTAQGLCTQGAVWSQAESSMCRPSPGLCSLRSFSPKSPCRLDWAHSPSALQGELGLARDSWYLWGSADQNLLLRLGGLGPGLSSSRTRARAGAWGDSGLG